MTSWLRTRRVWMLVAVAAVCAVAAAALTDEVAPMPVAVGTEGRALWSTFLPLLWVIAVADALASKAQYVEGRPGRRLILFDAGLFLSMCLVGTGVFASFAGTQSPVAVTAHVLVLTGLAGWVTLLGGPGAGVLASSSLLLLTTLYGTRAPLSRHVRVLQPDGDPHWALWVGIVLCLGALLTLVFGRESPR